MEKQSLNLGKALLNALYIIFIYGIFVLPWNIWIGSVKRFASKEAGESFTQSMTKTEFLVFNFLKSIFDAIIILIYIVGPILATVAGFRTGFLAFLSTLIAAYFAPLYLSLVKELLSLALIQVMKIEEIADNTKK